MSKPRKPAEEDPRATSTSLEVVAEKAAGERPHAKFVLPASGLAHEVLAQLEQAAFEETAQEEESEAWVAFGLDDDSFALPVDGVREVVRIEHITRVPHAAEAVAGLTTVWGQPIPVLDLRLRLGIEAKPLNAESRLLVTSGSRPLGLLVDRVEQVLRVLPSRVEPAPEELPGTVSQLASGSFDPGRGRSVLLDLDSVLSFQRGSAEKGIPADQIDGTS